MWDEHQRIDFFTRFYNSYIASLHIYSTYIADWNGV